MAKKVYPASKDLEVCEDNRVLSVTQAHQDQKEKKFVFTSVITFKTDRIYKIIKKFF